MLVAAVMISVSLARSPDDKEGWAGASWGSDPAPGMLCDAEGSDLRCYQPAGEDRVVGDVRLVQTSYYYGQEGLYQVLLVTEDAQDADVLLDGLELAYGTGTSVGSRTRWEGQAVSVTFVPGLPAGGASVFYEVKRQDARPWKAARDL